MKIVQILLLTNNQILISEIEEIGSELGEPDCKLVKPFLVNKDQTLTPWLSDFSSQDVFKMHSDKILTITEPKPTILEKYQELTK